MNKEENNQKREEVLVKIVEELNTECLNFLEFIHGYIVAMKKD